MCLDLNASLLDDSDSVKLNFLPIQPHCYLRIRIMGSCRGFLLLDCNTYLNIWNPSTGVKKRISLPPLISTTNYVCSYGFGYDPSTDDYLVVVVVLVPFDVRINVATSLELFSLRADTWTKIEGTRLPYMYPRIGRPVYKGLLLNGAIHWLCVHRRTTMLVIFAFDLMERSVYEIPLPDDFVGSFLSCDLRVLGGFLSLSVVVRNSKANIWVMKEYKVKSSWTKSIDGIPNVYFSPICSTKSGDIVGKDGGRLMKYNDKGQLQEHRLCCVFPRQYDEAMYTESLLSLPRRQ
ncbi:F-box/kelch-repeat protein At3g06240-like [Gastrolobium bilobum]|uniref:F-box/kelch-repeat protein At3g06240-like n=1 Tax=Gastrolobium bilobum TaxID=150636 RepID=UPI002AB00409|nr:F-box/kelch-repeat protein At3g06240-like [Gastrolobium bilobum]